MRVVNHQNMLSGAACLWVCLALFLAGCTSNPTEMLVMTPPEPNQAMLVQVSDEVMPEVMALTELSDDQKMQLTAFIEQDDIKHLSKKKQVSTFVNKQMINFNYEGKNYTATQALAKQAGNCMSLAMLTHGVAKELGVYSRFQLVHTAPLLTQITNDILVSSDHVRTLLFDEKPNGTFLSQVGYIVIDYFPDSNDRSGKIMSEDEFIAMFYRNLAADALLEGDLAQAFALSNKGINIAPKYTPLISLMGIIHRRINDQQTAENFYQYGLNLDESSLTLLNNYHFLLLTQGNKEAAQALKKKMLSIDNENPYGWYSMGMDAITIADFSSAEVYLNKFIRNTPYFHQAYFELAKAQFALGKSEKAQKSIQEAIKLTSMPDSQHKYLAKLNWLNHQAD
jgi:tetratricopeptide (TPR) repeat protein